MITSSTRLLAIFANPVAHSLSPVIQNAALQATNLDFVFMAFDIKKIGEAIKAMRTLDMRGVAISMPYKIEAIPWLNQLDPLAKKIGAVNTIVNENEQLIGYNTDAIGAITALEKQIPSLVNKNVVIFGAGGTARAIAFGLKDKGCHVTILNRTLKTAHELAENINGAFGELDDLPNLEAEILINATPVGMSPNENESIIPAKFFHPRQIVLDAIYHPLKTRFLNEAEKAGCKTITGLEMLIYQGAAQFKLWTGKDAPVEIMREAVLKQLAVEQVTLKVPKDL